MSGLRLLPGLLAAGLLLGAPLAAQDREGAPLAAQDREGDLNGWIRLSPHSSVAVAVDLELCGAGAERACEKLRLNNESKSPYFFQVRIPDALRRSDLRAYFTVVSPRGYASSEPDYLLRRTAGKPRILSPLVLVKSSAAFAGWLKEARKARGVDLSLALRRLERLEDWPLEPEEQLAVVLEKAEAFAHNDQWKRQQELLRDKFLLISESRIAVRQTRVYFKRRFDGFGRLVQGNFATLSDPAKHELRDLWYSLIADFASTYAACPLDAAVSAPASGNSSAVIEAQRKALRTWLGRPGDTVTQCAKAQPALACL